MIETSTPPLRRRGVYCNRTLNLRSIQAIGYDMDYTLVHYNVAAWEGRAYEHIKLRLLEAGWPIEELEFDPAMVTRGLVVDKELGNIVKANRFGYIKRAIHGANLMEHRAMRRAYRRTTVDLNEPRWYFLNTLFSISEACMYSQLVDYFDQDQLPEVRSYEELYAKVRSTLDAAHIEGELKAEIMASPQDYVLLDPEMPLALLDQKRAGKQLVLITNSEWSYTKFMLAYAFDQFLPGEMTWKDIFDIAVVSSRKPSFFSGRNPMLEVDEETGMLREFVGALEEGKVYFGGSAARVERYLGCSGDRILYVGDHLFTDVNVTKSLLRWRTALIMRELEDEIETLDEAWPTRARISALMQRKEQLEDQYSLLRIDLQRIEHDYGEHSARDPDAIRAEMVALREQLVALDDEIAPLVVEDGQAFSARWGYLMRTGKDKSHMARQVERYADIYTSRVSNFLRYTPFMYFRATRGSLPHDER